jgi:hypothetical protein
VILWSIKKDIQVATAIEYIKKRGTVGFLGGIWAMIPDIDYFLDEHMFDKPWADIFLFHRSFDVVLPETDLFFAAEMFLLFAVVNLFAMAASVKTFERVNEALFGKKEEDDDEDTSE